MGNTKSHGILRQNGDMCHCLCNKQGYMKHVQDIPGHDGTVCKKNAVYISSYLYGIQLITTSHLV